MYILALESSTTSAKVMLYNTRTKTYEVKTKVYSEQYKDITIHNAETVFNETMDIAGQLCKGKEIDIITLGGTWHGLLLCNSNLEAETPVYLWSYTQASEICNKLRMDETYVSSFYQRTGCMVNGIYPFFKLKHLEEKGYPLSQYMILDQGSYNMYKLTGEYVTTDSLASGSGLLNIHTKQYDNTLLTELNIDEKQLPKLITYQETFPLKKEMADRLGIKDGIPVMATCPDGGLNQVGAGAIMEGVMTFSVGTSGALRLSTGEPLIPDKPSTWCYLSPKSWLSGAATSGSCNCIDWAKDRLFPDKMSYGEIEEGILNPMDPPVFLPFLFGERCPGWEDDRLGSFESLKPFHNAHDQYLAVMEGVLFNLYQCYSILVEANDVPKRIKLSGGILNSEMWTQMCVDIFAMDMEVNEIEHSSLMGSVALGMELVGEIEDASQISLGETKIIYHNPEMHAGYMKKYNKYLQYYEKTKMTQDDKHSSVIDKI